MPEVLHGEYHVDDPHIAGRIQIASEELKKGLEMVCQHPKSVSIFGSARFKEGDEYYEKARSIAKKIADEDFDVITGGGPGIMEAGNRGAYESDSPKHSIGFNIMLPFEQELNPYIDKSVDFHYFFTRKVSLTYSAEAYLYFPGGFGTLDEFFEIATLVQTKKIPQVPIILVGNEFWGSLDTFFKTELVEKYKTISPEDRELYTITEDEDTILEIVKSTKERNKVC